ncbi:MAG: FecR domain-containing protein [Bacteroidales bacterium]|nr:FecR domain-containing protein [Bacteroidales bacterium]
MELQELIAKYVSNSATEAENAKLLELLARSNENKELFLDSVASWNTVTDSEALLNRFDYNKALKEFENKIEDISLKNIKSASKVTNLFRNRYLQLAAGLILIIGLFFVFKSTQKTDIVISETNTENTVKSLILPDGSKVFLYKNAQISYKEDFNNKTRTIQSSGLIYFEIAKNPLKPFIIEAGAIELKVLGTSFEFKNDIKNNVEVVLESGKVEILHKAKNKRIILNPGYKAVFSKEQERLESFINNDVNYNSWKTGMLVFQKDSFSKVIKDIEKLYNITISYDTEKLVSCKLTAKFDNEPLEVIFHTLELTFGVEITKKDSSQIIIKGEGC